MSYQQTATPETDLAAKRRLLARLLHNRLGVTNYEAGETSSENDVATNIETAIKQSRLGYPALQKHLYFNYGGQGPLASSVIAEIQKTLLEVENLGSFSNEAMAYAQIISQKTRRALANLLGAAPERVVLTEGATTGCNIILWGLTWQPGDHLLISDQENPSLLAAVKSLQECHKLDVEFFPARDLTDAELLEDVGRRLRVNTRLVALSHILWTNGRVMPFEQIAALCRETGRAHLLVDGAQAAGVLPLQLAASQADYYAFGGQKWLCGPTGTGGLYISEEGQAALRPVFSGWRNLCQEEHERLAFHDDARRFEVSGASIALQAGLCAALASHESLAGIDLRRDFLLKCSHYLWRQLKEFAEAEGHIAGLFAAAPESGIVSFSAPASPPSEIVDFLASQAILTRVVAPPVSVRVCVHYLTTVDEIDELVTALKLFFRIRRGL